MCWNALTDQAACNIVLLLIYQRALASAGCHGSWPAAASPGMGVLLQAMAGGHLRALLGCRVCFDVQTLDDSPGIY